MASTETRVAKINRESQQDTNEYNKSMVDSTNQANYDLWQAQNAEQWRMWEAENQYNSASNQANRLSQAGINPLLAMTGQNAGVASNMTAPAPIPKQAFQKKAEELKYADILNNPITRLGEHLPRTFAEIKNAFAIATQNETKAVHDVATNSAKIEQTMAQAKRAMEDSKKSVTERLAAEQEYQYLGSYLGNRNRNMEMQVNLTNQEYLKTQQDIVKSKAETDSILLENEFKKLNLPIRVETAKAILKQTYASTAMAYAQRDLSKEQGKYYIQCAAESAMKTTGVHIDNEQKRRLMPFIVSQTVDAMHTQLSENANKRQYNDWLFGVDNFYKDKFLFPSKATKDFGLNGVLSLARGKPKNYHHK